MQSKVDSIQDLWQNQVLFKNRLERLPEINIQRTHQETKQNENCKLALH
jgi:hypothetical protein